MESSTFFRNGYATGWRRRPRTCEATRARARSVSFDMVRDHYECPGLGELGGRGVGNFGDGGAKFSGRVIAPIAATQRCRRETPVVTVIGRSRRSFSNDDVSRGEVVHR